MAENKLPAYRWVILILVSCVAFMGNYSQFQVSIYAVTLMEGMGIDLAGFNMLLMMPMLAGAVTSIPLGSLGDRYGAKKIVGVLSVVAALGAFIRAFTMDSFMWQMISTGLMSLSICSMAACLLKIYSVWFQEKTDFAMGIFFATACLGIVVAQACGPMFPSVFSAYFSTAIIMAVLAVLWNIFVKDRPEGIDPLPPEPILDYLKVAAKSKNVWIISLAVGFGLASTTAYAGIAPQMLELEKGVTMQMAGIMAAVLTLGSSIGSIIGPAIVGRAGKTKYLLVCLTVFGAICMFANWYMPMGIMMWIGLILNGTTTAFIGPVLQAMPYQLPEIRAKYAGSAGGLVSAVSLLMTFFLPVIFAAIAGDSMEINLGLNSICYLAAVICILILPELGPEGKIAKEIAAKEAAEMAAAEKACADTQ